MENNTLEKLLLSIYPPLITLIIGNVFQFLKNAYTSTDIKNANSDFINIISFYITNNVFPTHEILKATKLILAKKYGMKIYDFISIDDALSYSYCTFLSSQTISSTDKKLFEEHFNTNKSHFRLNDYSEPETIFIKPSTREIKQFLLEIFILSLFFFFFFILSFYLNGENLSIPLLVITISASLILGSFGEISGIIMVKIISFFKKRK